MARHSGTVASDPAPLLSSRVARRAKEPDPRVSPKFREPAPAAHRDLARMGADPASTANARVPRASGAVTIDRESAPALVAGDQKRTIEIAEHDGPAACLES